MVGPGRTGPGAIAAGAGGLAGLSAAALSRPVVAPGGSTGGSHTAQILKFLSTGGVATLVSIGLFNLLVHAGEDPVLATQPLPAYVLAIAAGTAVSYVGNRWWAFAHHASRGVARDLPAFVAINLVALGIPLACLSLSRYALGADSALADNISVNFVGLVMATAFRYWGYRSWVFTGPETREARR